MSEIQEILDYYAREAELARAGAGLPPMLPDFEREDPLQLVEVEEVEGEVRVTDPETGGAKGQKLAQLGAVDPAALLEVAKVAGFGAQKYDRMNFTKGYAYSLSFDAMMRHLLLFWDGQELDEESGLPHLAHAAWHCLALLTFSQRGRGRDDRLAALPHMREASEGREEG